MILSPCQTSSNPQKKRVATLAQWTSGEQHSVRVHMTDMAFQSTTYKAFLAKTWPLIINAEHSAQKDMTNKNNCSDDSHSEKHNCFREAFKTDHGHQNYNCSLGTVYLPLSSTTL